jgi:hypothetical protein
MTLNKYGRHFSISWLFIFKNPFRNKWNGFWEDRDQKELFDYSFGKRSVVLSLEDLNIPSTPLSPTLITIL